MECKSNCDAHLAESIFRINRYIMECKLDFYAYAVNFLYELIDTLWNVNIFVTLVAAV